MTSTSTPPASEFTPGEDLISPDDVYHPPAWVLWLRKRIWWIGIALALLFVTAMHFLLQRRPEPPPVLSELGEFSLVDQEGRSFGPEQMRGKVWVVGFIFTRCPSVCPAVSQAMLHFDESFVSASRISDEVNLLTVTVDPEFDRPEVLKGYAEKLGADLSHWSFVTGSKAEIDDFVVGGFKLAVGERKPDAEDPSAFDISHSVKLAVVDRHGKVRHYASTDAESLNEMYHRLFAIMRAEADTP